MKIDKENDLIGFNEDDHKYIIKDTGESLISVTTLIHEYAQPFDEHYWSCVKALEELIGATEFAKIKKDVYASKKFNTKFVQLYDIPDELFIKKKTEILHNWENTRDEACDRGTKYHKMREDLINGGSVEEVNYLKLGGKFKCYTDNKLKPGDKGIYPEILLHYISPSGRLKLAGQADVLIIDGNSIQIMDFKTNKEIKKRGYFNATTKTTKKMKYPLTNVEDANYGHYIMQLSTYIYMVKQIDPSLTFGSSTIIHYDHKGKTTYYDLPYLETEVIKMLNHYESELVKKEQYEKLKPFNY